MATNIARWAVVAATACSGGAIMEMGMENGRDAGGISAPANPEQDSGVGQTDGGIGQMDGSNRMDGSARADGSVRRTESLCNDTGEAFVDCFDASGMVSDVSCNIDPKTEQQYCGSEESCMAAYVTSSNRHALPDLVCTNNSGLFVYKNNGGFEFTDITATTGIMEIIFDMYTQSRMPQGATFGDINNDFCDDLIVTWASLESAEAVHARDTNGLPVTVGIAMFQNDCSGHFTDVSGASGFGAVQVNELALFSEVSLADINGDAKLDLLITRGTQEYGLSVLWLYISQPDGTWRKRNDILPLVDGGRPYTIFGQDADGDGWEDINMLSNPNSSPTASSHVFLRVVGKGLAFTEANVPIGRPIDAMGGAIAILSMGRVFAITDIGHNHLFLIPGAKGWRNIAADVGAEITTNLDPYPQGGEWDNQFVGFAPRFLDMNGDGFLDMVITSARDNWNRGPPRTRVLLWSPTEGRFAEATDEVLGPHSKHAASGLTVADVDGDGRPDLIPSNQGPVRPDGQNVDSYGNPIGPYPEGEIQRMQLLWNRTSGNAFSLRVMGDGTRLNTNGIGALVTITTPDGLTQGKAIQPYGSNQGLSEARVFFGLEEQRSAEVTITLPNGGETENVRIEIPEGRTAARVTYDVADGELYYDPL